MYMIQIETKEMEKASEYAEKALKYMGKVMQCISSWEDEAYGERGGMNYREHEEYGRYGKHSGGMNERYPYMGMRDDEDYEDEMNERRGGRRRRSNGRYY
jgi:hypothetical protein